MTKTMKRTLLLILVLCPAVQLKAENVVFNYVSLTDMNSRIVVGERKGKTTVHIGAADFFVGVKSCRDDINFTCLHNGSVSFSVPKEIESYIPKDKEVGKTSWEHNKHYFIMQPQQGRIPLDEEFEFIQTYNLWGKEVKAYRVSSFRVKPGTSSNFMEGYTGDFIWSPVYGLLAYTSFHGESCDNVRKQCDQVFHTYWLMGKCGYGANASCK
jgi:hypothetical protein